MLHYTYTFILNLNVFKHNDTVTPCIPSKVGPDVAPPMLAANVRCVESTAEASTCTTVGQELYTLTNAPSGSGAACTGSSTLCDALGSRPRCITKL